MLILARPAPRPGIGIRTGHLINPSSTLQVDSIPNTTLSNKWIITLSDSVDELVSSYEVLATNNFGTKLSYTIYAKIGDHVSHNLDIKFDGTDIVLEIENTGLNVLLINIVRIDTNN